MDRIFLHQPAPGAPELPEALHPYAAAIAAHLQQPAAWFVPLNQLATTPAQSKIGGWPYLPTTAPNPLLDDEGEHRYNLLVQLNLAEVPMPRPEFLPAQGLLQFFTREAEDILDDDARALRCVYYPTIAADSSAVVTDFSAYDLGNLEGYENVPPEGLAVAFQTLTANRVEWGNDAGGMAPLFADVADDERAALLKQLAGYLAAYNETVPDNGEEWTDFVAAQYPSEDGQMAFKSPIEWWGYSIPDHQLGGLPSQFWQGDPRLAQAGAHARPYHDRLLLAYDARGNCTEWAVPFLTHDAKLLFFISREQLSRLDFSDLLFEYMA